MSDREYRARALVGTLLGDAYKLTRLIGQGGMGAVYEGVQVRLNRRVAVKVVVGEPAADPEALTRFRREVHIASQLAHPHIIQVSDFGAAPTGEPYLVMEYLEGEDLEGRLQRVRRMSLADTERIVTQAASALSATHARGIVHRDLKPANVFLLSVEGVTDFVKVVDFGISKMMATSTHLTRASVVLGTPKYMSPEQALGRIREVDHRSDQWALACIAWEMLSGREPFVGADVPSVMYEVVHGELPQALSPGVPAAVEEVLRRALIKRPRDRFPTIAAFARAFTAACAAPEPVTVPAPTEERVVPPVLKRASTPGRASQRLRSIAGTLMRAMPVLSRRREPVGIVGHTMALGRRALSLLPSRRKRPRRRWIFAATIGASLLLGAALIVRWHTPTPPAVRFVGPPLPPSR
jgi:eukaryotic-like serine/threonine-protein kinase